MREAFESMRREKWGKLDALTEPWTQRCPVDLDAHMLRAIALEQSGRAEEGGDHPVCVRGLFEAVLATGDGKTPAAAYQVNSAFEEYSMLRLFGSEPKQQALADGGIDAMTVVAESGEQRTVYFDPAASFERMRRAFEAERPRE